jgi:site-specific DNA-adenine methylase
MKIKPVIGRVGGKARLAPWILEFIKQHQFSIYCEPFCGSAAVYFSLLNDGIPEQVKARGRHFRAVLNDADKEIMNLYKTVRDYPELLAYSVYFTPYSRAEHKEAQQRGEGDRVEEAKKYLVDGWQSFQKQNGSGWCAERNNLADCYVGGKHLGGAKSLNKDWHTLPSRILTASKHLGTPHQELLEMAETLIQLALSEKPIDHELEARLEHARRYLVDGWQSGRGDIGGEFAITRDNLMDRKENGIHIGGARNHPKTFETLFTRILTAAPHLGTPETLDPYACLNAVGRAFVEPDVDIRVEWVRRYLVDGWQSFTYNPGNSWGVNRYYEKHDEFKENLGNWNTLPSRILTAAPHLQRDLDALKKVYLECDDAIKCIERWATPETLFYCDPPYIGAEGYYSHNAKQGKDYNLELHHRLAECLNSVECAGAIVSYYPDALLDELYPEEHWERHYKETVASSAGITRSSKTRTRPKRTELLLVRKQRNPSAVRVAMCGQLSLSW